MRRTGRTPCKEDMKSLKVPRRVLRVQGCFLNYSARAEQSKVCPDTPRLSAPINHR